MKVLLVEDSQVLRERIGHMIAAIPEAELVAQADTERDARRCLTQHQPNVLVLDLRLREGSGLAVLEHVKSAFPAITVVVLTNYGEAAYRERCLGLGADHFFDKTRDIVAFGAQMVLLAFKHGVSEEAGAPPNFLSNQGELQ